MWMFINFLRSPFFIHFWFLRCCAQCTFRIFKLNLIFVSGAFGQTHWRGRSRFPSNPPLFPPRPTNPEQPNCDQGEKKTSNSCHRCHFPNFLYHCSSLGYPNSAQALCLDARKSSEIFLDVDVDVGGVTWF